VSFKRRGKERKKNDWRGTLFFFSNVKVKVKVNVNLHLLDNN